MITYHRIAQDTHVCAWVCRVLAQQSEVVYITGWHTLILSYIPTCACLACACYPLNIGKDCQPRIVGAGRVREQGH